MPEKILLVGPVNGRLSDLISKVSAIQSKHGPFAALFILGDLFHLSPSETQIAQQHDLLQGKLQLPIPTYFYQGSTPPSDALTERIVEAAGKGNEYKDTPSGLVRIADNLFYATGKSGVFTTQHGFRIAFVGGLWDAAKYAEAAAEQFDAETWYESDLGRKQDEGLAHITPATIHRLLAHPSFRLPSPPSSSPSTTQNNGAKAGTLAAARATASADQARITAQTAALEALNARPPIDLLLTNCWPTGITLFSPEALPDPTTRMWGSPAIARLAAHACPRYHFSLASSATDSDLPVGIESETLNMGAFWERSPYMTDLSSALSNRPQLLETPAGRRQVEKLKSVTRFVSLARFANEKKKRWFLALNLTPAEQQEVAAVPANATQTPFFTPSAASAVAGQNGKRAAPAPVDDSAPNFRFQESKRARGNEDVPPKGYVCRICNTEGHFIRACPQKQQQQQPTANTDSSEKSHMPLPAGLPSKPTSSQQRTMIPVGPSNCWFCLSNPNVTKSLIVSIGSESYLVFPKGGFVHPSISNVPGDAAHVLVVPLSHVSNLLPTDHPVVRGGGEGGEEERGRTRAEMETTKQTVRAVWAETNHAMLEWTLVRVRTSSRMTHFQTQLVALLSSIVDGHDLVQVLDDALVSTSPKQILRGEEASSFFSWTEGDELDGYFHLALHLESGEKREWLVPLTTKCRFPVQLVRTTLANTLQLPQLADWKTAQCEGESEESERERSAGLRRLLAG